MPNRRLSRGASARLAVLACAVAAELTLSRAHAGEAHSVCTPIAGPRHAINGAAGGRWIELTDLQRAFLAGIFVLNPNTASGLPFGDKAVLSQIDGGHGGVVFFIDGDQACSPMPVPDELVAMIRAIGAGDVSHEGTEN